MRSTPVTGRSSIRPNSPRITSAGASLIGSEDIIADLTPVFDTLNAIQAGRRLALAEKDFHDVSRESWFQECFFQIVYKVCATIFLDETDFFLPRGAEKNVFRRKPYFTGVEKALRSQPIASGLAGVVSRPERGGRGFMADDIHGQSLFDTALEKLQHAGKRLRLGHPWAVDVSLQFRPVIFPALAAEKIAHVVFAGGQ